MILLRPCDVRNEGILDILQCLEWFSLAGQVGFSEFGSWRKGGRIRACRLGSRGYCVSRVLHAVLWWGHGFWPNKIALKTTQNVVYGLSDNMLRV